MVIVAILVIMVGPRVIGNFVRARNVASHEFTIPVPSLFAWSHAYLLLLRGDVKLVEIDGPVVKLELVGACGTCPSSTMTMKMGLERKLKERIPEIEDVIQSLPDAPELNNCNLETVLDGVRPFLKVAGGKISVESLSGVGSMQPGVKLKMEGTAASLQSVKSEIMQRIQRHFKIAVRVEWV